MGQFGFEDVACAVMESFDLINPIAVRRERAAMRWFRSGLGHEWRRCQQKKQEEPGHGGDSTVLAGRIKLMFRCRTAFGIALVLFLLSSVATHAQVGVYATANGAWFGGVTCPSFAPPCAETDGKVKPFGSNIGA